VTVIDLADPVTLRPALDGVDSVFLLSATEPEQTRQELNVLAAANAAAVKRIVKLSVWRADELLTPIARAHRPVEQTLESSGLTWTFLRPNVYMQNFAGRWQGDQGRGADRPARQPRRDQLHRRPRRRPGRRARTHLRPPRRAPV